MILPPKASLEPPQLGDMIVGFGQPCLGVGPGCEGRRGDELELKSLPGCCKARAHAVRGFHHVRRQDSPSVGVPKSSSAERARRLLTS